MNLSPASWQATQMCYEPLSKCRDQNQLINSQKHCVSMDEDFFFPGTHKLYHIPLPPKVRVKVGVSQRKSPGTGYKLLWIQERDGSSKREVRQPPTCRTRGEMKWRTNWEESQMPSTWERNGPSHVQAIHFKANELHSDHQSPSTCLQRLEQKGANSKIRMNELRFLILHMAETSSLES